MKRGRRLPVALSDVAMCEFGTNVPALYITIPDFPELEDLTDKETYLNAVLKVDGNGWFEDLDSAPVLIKGRGNSTWGYPKKPYRLKFDKKISICGFDKSKKLRVNCKLYRLYVDEKHNSLENSTIIGNAIHESLSTDKGLF